MHWRDESRQWEAICDPATAYRLWGRGGVLYFLLSSVDGKYRVSRTGSSAVTGRPQVLLCFHAMVRGIPSLVLRRCGAGKVPHGPAGGRAGLWQWCVLAVLCTGCLLYWVIQYHPFPLPNPDHLGFAATSRQLWHGQLPSIYTRMPLFPLLMGLARLSGATVRSGAPVHGLGCDGSCCALCHGLSFPRYGPSTSA